MLFKSWIISQIRANKPKQTSCMLKSNTKEGTVFTSDKKNINRFLMAQEDEEREGGGRESTTRVQKDHNCRV